MDVIVKRMPTAYAIRSQQGSPISEADKLALRAYDARKNAKADAFAERMRQSAHERSERLTESRRK